MDVVDDVDLALMLCERQAAGAIREPPLPCLVVDRQPHELDESGGVLSFCIEPLGSDFSNKRLKLLPRRR